MTVDKVAAVPQSVSGTTTTPATPDYCRVLGSIAPLDAAAQLVNFRLNLPTARNGKAMQYGGGYNGTLVSGLAPLDRWVAAGQAPPDALVQTVKATVPPFTVQASRPMCRYPGSPR
jgi:hypothetical protein